MIGQHEGAGDLLARGARTATFLGPKVKIDESVFQADLLALTKEQFIDKYFVTDREYNRLATFEGGRDFEEYTVSFVKDANEKLAAFERQQAADTTREARVQSRECFIDPSAGRLIVLRDGPTPSARSSRIIIAKDPKRKTLLPTTGHVVACGEGTDHWFGKRVLFGQMSGTAICFNGYPEWIILQVEEIMGEVKKEDIELVEEELQPMV